MEERTSYTRVLPENGGCGLGERGIKSQKKLIHGLICSMFIGGNFTSLTRSSWEMGSSHKSWELLFDSLIIFCKQFSESCFAKMSRRASYAGGSKLPTGKTNGFAGQENGAGAPFGPAAPPRKRFDPPADESGSPTLTSKVGLGT